MMKLHVIGAGTPDPLAERFGSCFVLELADQMLMVDCGPASTYKLAQAGIHPRQIERLFFTHHHSDHNADYACFLLTRWDQDPGTFHPLRVCGPPPTREVTQRLIGPRGAYRVDIEARLHHPASEKMHSLRGGTLPRFEPTFDVRDIKPGPVEENAKWRMTALAVHHIEPYLTSVGYRFESDEATVAFLGDAGPCDALTELSRDADLVVACCAYVGDLPRELTDVVCGPADVARIGKESGAKTMLLTHASSYALQPHRRAEAIRQVVQGGYTGRVIFADELLTVPVA